MNADLGNSTFGNSIRAAERQRVSRELHNSTSQLLVALQLQLSQLRKFPGLDAAHPLFDEIGLTLQNIHESIKKIETEPDDEQALEDGQVRTARLFFSLAETDRLSR